VKERAGEEGVEEEGVCGERDKEKE